MYIMQAPGLDGSTELLIDQAKKQDEQKSYLNYPAVSDLLAKAKEKQEESGKVVFHCIDIDFTVPFTPKVVKDQASQRTVIETDWEAKFREVFQSPLMKKASMTHTGSFAKRLERVGCHMDLIRGSKDYFLGAPLTHSSSLLTRQIGGIKVLGDFSFAYVEARANHHYRKFYYDDKQIDCYWASQGIANLDLFAEVLKAHEIAKDKLNILLVPANAIKAFREAKFGSWTEVELEHKTASFNEGKVYQYDKYGNLNSEIPLIEYKAKNLKSPVYRAKAGEYNVVLVPISESAACQFSLPEDKGGFSHAAKTRIDNSTQEGNIVLQVDHHDIATVTENGKSSIESIEKALSYVLPSEGVISCSVGQAVRVIFELLGGFENIPEAILFADGGSWSSIVTEKNSDGRHQGLYNMNDVFTNEWHKRDDIALPWNYLGWDELNVANEYLKEDDNNHLISVDSDKTKSLSEKKAYIEAPQTWKPVGTEFLIFMIKTVYREFLQAASRKYHINIRDCIELVAKFIGRTSLFNHNKESYDRKRELEILNVSDELLSFLDAVSYVHNASAAMCDFYSTKTHPVSIMRLQWLARAHRELVALCPHIESKLSAEIRQILSKDKKTEFTTLYDLYMSEYNKLCN